MKPKPRFEIPDTLKGGHQTASVPPGMVEMMTALRDWREALMESVEVGGIVECKRDIECIDEIMRMLERHDVFERNRQVILKALWAYDTEVSRAAYEAIHFGRRNS